MNINLFFCKMPSKTLKYKSGEIKINYVFNKKSSAIYLALLYNTKEDNLLYYLLEKFISEKVLVNGLNINNHIMNAYATSKGIFLIVPDSKVFSIIQQIQRYLLSSELNSQQAKLIGDGSYKKLHNDIKSFTVYITGKCRLTEKSISSSDKKIDNFIKNIESISPKNIDDFSLNGKYENEIINVDKLTPYSKLMFCICYDKIPYVFNGNKIVMLNSSSLDNLKEKALFKNVFQGKIKSFQTQFGNIGTPSANDKDGKKHKEKCNLILSSVNIMCEMISALHGFSFKFDKIDDIRSVCSISLGDMKKIKF